MRAFLPILTVYCLVVFDFALHAQTSFQPVYEIKSDTATEQSLDSLHFQVLTDKEGKWTIEEVSALPLVGMFHARVGRLSEETKDRVQTCWYVYELKNTMDVAAKISFEYQVDIFDVFIKRGDSAWVHNSSGMFQDWNKKDGLKAAGEVLQGAIPIELAPGERVVVYERRYKKEGLSLSDGVILHSTEKIFQSDYIDVLHARLSYFSKLEMLDAFMEGLLFLAIVFSLFFYFVLHEKINRYFALFALFLLIRRAHDLFWDYSQWEHPEWVPYVTYISYTRGFIPYYLIQIVREFFQTPKTFPRWDKCLIGLGILNIIVCFVTFMSEISHSRFMPAINYWFFIVAFVIIPIGIVITLMMFIRKRKKFTRFFIVGLSPLMWFYIVAGGPLLFGKKVKLPLPLAFLEHNFRAIEIGCIIWVIVFFSLILFMRYDMLRRENAQRALDNERLLKEIEIERNRLIEAQKVELECEVAARTAELAQSLQDLKESQNHLIQKEKMASLGELTAGIAHEIQNPLNFVNNFSELSVGLTKELNEEIAKTPIPQNDKDYIAEILTDLTHNQEKINHHGKRASAIVKGMMEHARTTTGARESTDLNQLTDEYLRLSYHGLRAKDKTFNADYQTDFDPHLPKANIVQQEIGRVLLNLFNNAFYAVNERAKKEPKGTYQPTVTAITKQMGDFVEIRVKDNGDGIPHAIQQKVFQPFFTTKPPGEGTGLGLSLAYHMITKGHDGTLEVESIEGVGTEFIIRLPLKPNR